MTGGSGREGGVVGEGNMYQIAENTRDNELLAVGWLVGDEISRDWSYIKCIISLRHLLGDRRPPGDYKRYLIIIMMHFDLWYSRDS